MTQPAGEVARRQPGISRADVDKVPVDITMPLRTLDEAWRVAVMLSQSDFVPVQLRGKEINTLVVLLTGVELGLTPTQSLRSIYISKSGMPALYVEMMLAKVRQAGHDYDWKYPEPDRCVFYLTRKDSAKTYETEYSLADAKIARLVSEDKYGNLVALSLQGKPLPWMLHSKDMLFARAAGRAVKRVCPEVTLGFQIAEAMDPEGPPPGPGLPVPEPKPEGPPPPADAVQAEVIDLDRQMTPAAQDDTHKQPSGASGEPQGGRGRRNRGAPPPAPQGHTAAPFGTGGRPAESVEPGLEALPPRDESDRVTEAERLSVMAEMGAGPSHHEAWASGDFTHAGEEPDPTGAPTAGTPTEETPAASSTALPAAEALSKDTLLGRFETCGWAWSPYYRSVLDAIRDYVRRPVQGIADLSAIELESLSAVLGRLIAKHPEEHLPVALADEVEKWREDWHKADPAGYAAEHPDG
jgi:hypothetical protein